MSKPEQPTVHISTQYSSWSNGAYHYLKITVTGGGAHADEFSKKLASGLDTEAKKLSPELYPRSPIEWRNWVYFCSSMLAGSDEEASHWKVTVVDAIASEVASGLNMPLASPTRLAEENARTYEEAMRDGSIPDYSVSLDAGTSKISACM